MADKDWKAIHKQEVVKFVRNFYETSNNWRRQAYDAKWDKYERNYRNIYDPDIAAKKESWQATMFVPATVTSVEVITASLTKIGSGKKRPIALEPRESGDELQAELNTDIVDYYREKGDYDLNRYHVIKELSIYGSAFMKVYWEKKYAKRRVVKDKMETLLSAMAKMRMPQKIGTTKDWEDVLVKDGVTFKHIHIRNIFPEPNFTDLSRLIHREKLTYNELRQLADQGLFDSDSVKELFDVTENDNFEDDLRTSKGDQGVTDPKLPRQGFDKRHTVWEYSGPLPLKWINLDMPEDTEEQKKAAMEVTPGKAFVASADYFLASGESNNYTDEPEFVKADYIPSPGGGYGIGVAQLIEGLQDEFNEIRNQRIDNVTLIMNKMIAVVEKYIVDPKELRSKPGGIIRFKGSEIDDIRKAFAEIQISDVPLSAFRETGELERQIQETTAANRVTTGTAGLVNDTNQTLGGMELMRQAAFDRFTVYAFIIGRTLDVKIAKKVSELVYLNISDESVRRILGDVPIETLPGEFVARWQTWKRQSPEEIDICYDFVPVDVFSQENKMQKSQDLASKMQLMASVVPGWNPVPAIKRLFKYSELSSDEVSELMEGLEQGPMPTPMGMGQGVPSISRPTKQTSSETPPSPAGGMGNPGMQPLG